jgi:peroxiredoxin
MKRFVLAAIACAALSTSALADTLQPFEEAWLNGAQDATYKTSDHPDGVFVLEFYANFCGACNENADNVNALSAQYKTQSRVQVLDMSLDTDPGEQQAWINNHNPNHPVLNDGQRTVWSQLNESYIPTTVIMDCKGNVVWKNTGVWGDDEKATIKQNLDALLGQSCG